MAPDDCRMRGGRVLWLALAVGARDNPTFRGGNVHVRYSGMAQLPCHGLPASAEQHASSHKAAASPMPLQPCWLHDKTNSSSTMVVDCTDAAPACTLDTAEACGGCTSARSFLLQAASQGAGRAVQDAAAAGTAVAAVAAAAENQRYLCCGSSSAGSALVPLHDAAPGRAGQGGQDTAAGGGTTAPAAAAAAAPAAGHPLVLPDAVCAHSAAADMMDSDISSCAADLEVPPCTALPSSKSSCSQGPVQCPAGFVSTPPSAVHSALHASYPHPVMGSRGHGQNLAMNLLAILTASSAPSPAGPATSASPTATVPPKASAPSPTSTLLTPSADVSTAALHVTAASNPLAPSSTVTQAAEISSMTLHLNAVSTPPTPPPTVTEGASAGPATLHPDAAAHHPRSLESRLDPSAAAAVAATTPVHPAVAALHAHLVAMTTSTDGSTSPCPAPPDFPIASTSSAPVPLQAVQVAMASNNLASSASSSLQRDYRDLLHSLSLDDADTAKATPVLTRSQLQPPLRKAGHTSAACVDSVAEGGSQDEDHGQLLCLPFISPSLPSEGLCGLAAGAGGTAAGVTGAGSRFASLSRPDGALTDTPAQPSSIMALSSTSAAVPYHDRVDALQPAQCMRPWASDLKGINTFNIEGPPFSAAHRSNAGSLLHSGFSDDHGGGGERLSSPSHSPAAHVARGFGGQPHRTLLQAAEEAVSLRNYRRY